MTKCESDLRALWETQGLPVERQNALIAEIQRKASPTYLANIFSRAATDAKTVAERKWQAPKLAPKPQKPCDHGLFSDEADQLDLVEMFQEPTNEA